jgi:hypothetical protein
VVSSKPIILADNLKATLQDIFLKPNKGAEPPSTRLNEAERITKIYSKNGGTVHEIGGLVYLTNAPWRGWQLKNAAGVYDMTEPKYIGKTGEVDTAASGAKTGAESKITGGDEAKTGGTERQNTSGGTQEGSPPATSDAFSDTSNLCITINGVEVEYKLQLYRVLQNGQFYFTYSKQIVERPGPIFIEGEIGSLKGVNDDNKSYKLGENVKLGRCQDRPVEF